MNTETENILLEIEKQINQVVFSSMIIGRFPKGWSFEAYNNFLENRRLTMRCYILSFVNFSLQETERTSLSDQLQKLFPNLYANIYDTYIFCLCFSYSDSLPCESPEKLIEAVKNYSHGDVLCYSSKDISDVTCLTEEFAMLKEEAEAGPNVTGKDREALCIGLYALESELFKKVCTGDMEEIDTLLLAITDNLMEEDRVFLTDEDDILICLRSYFTFLWRQISREVYKKTGKRKTIRSYITIDLDINAAKEYSELISLLLHYIQELNEELCLSKGGNFHRIIENVKLYVIENCSDDVSLKNVAEKVGLSSYYLSKLFKKEEGCNFKDYVISVRMEKAMKLIHEGKKNVNEIAASVGYSNTNYFSTAFHRYFHKTAKELLIRNG